MDNEYNSILPLNEDWYDDQANKSLKWDDTDTAIVGAGAAYDVMRGSTGNNSNLGASVIGSYLGVWIGKGIVYLVYKGKAHKCKFKRERAYKKDSVTKDYTNTIKEFIQSPVKGADVNKNNRENGMIEICCKNSLYRYSITYDNMAKSIVIDMIHANSGAVLGNLTPKNKSDADNIIRKYFSPYVSEEDLAEYMEKGYGYHIYITDCPANDLVKDIANMSDTTIKVRGYKESVEYNEIL